MDSNIKTLFKETTDWSQLTKPELKKAQILCFPESTENLNSSDRFLLRSLKNEALGDRWDAYFEAHESEITEQIERLEGQRLAAQTSFEKNTCYYLSVALAGDHPGMNPFSQKEINRLSGVLRKAYHNPDSTEEDCQALVKSTYQSSAYKEFVKCHEMVVDDLKDEITNAIPFGELRTELLDAVSKTEGKTSNLASSCLSIIKTYITIYQLINDIENMISKKNSLSQSQQATLEQKLMGLKLNLLAFKERMYGLLEKIDD